MEKQRNYSFFARELLAWYDTHRRDLPWRKSQDPYHIWVSEIMLQQTRVDTVIPYFHRFIEQFPTIDALAEAPEEEVLKCWEGLGYYSRARNLHAAVKEVKENYGSQVPDQREDILKLKGVGPYTAGAVLSIAYGRPEPAVDGNVMRVLSRFLLITEDIMKVRTRTMMEEQIREMIPALRAGDFNQALMELGALVCTPRAPQCLICPVMSRCQARLEGLEEELPVRTRAKPPKPVYKLAAFIEGTGDKQGQFLIRKRPETGLLASMWELPHYDCGQLPFEASATHGDWLANKLMVEGIKAEHPLWTMDAEHTFSHLKWFMKVYRLSGAPLTAQSLPHDQYRWIESSEIAEYAFPTVFNKIMSEVLRI